MVTGMEVFRRHFAGYEDSFALIGGAACDLWFTRFGGRFRTTKDIDLVLLLEARQEGFFSRFWEFIRSGAYRVGQRTDGQPTFFRFLDPATENYPKMIEVFSSAPMEIEILPGQTITPIPSEDDVSSLSAILLNADYYAFILEQRTVMDGTPLIQPSGLIPLKVRAWLDLTKRRQEGDERIKTDNINKHRSDVFRIATLLPVGENLSLPSIIADDLRAFLTAFPVSSPEWSSILNSLAATGITMSPDALIQILEQFFQTNR